MGVKLLATNKKLSARPALSEEAKLNEMISLAMDQAEEQLRSKTAPAQIVAHFLKLGTPAAKLEREKLEKENQLLEAKTELIKSTKQSDEIYSEALAAMKLYTGNMRNGEEENI